MKASDPSGLIGIFFDGAGQNAKTDSAIKELYDAYDGEKEYITIGILFDATKGFQHFNQNIDAAFQKYAIPWRVKPGGTNTGFLFVNVSEGVKFVNVELWHSKGVIDVGFASCFPIIVFFL